MYKRQQEIMININSLSIPASISRIYIVKNFLLPLSLFLILRQSIYDICHLKASEFDWCSVTMYHVDYIVRHEPPPA